jgi:hypothetical protein
MESILIIGYGKIGSLKSRIYKSLGFDVYVFDPYKKEIPYKTLKKLNADLDLENFMFDICTPTSRHVKDLEKIISLKPDANILVEKPLCNNPEDYRKYKKLINQNPQCKVNVSENYLYSDTIREIKEYLLEKDQKITSIEIEFSKDRREDTLRGRFVDEKLGGLGIEIPHMLSILYSLGLYNIEVVDVKKKCGDSFLEDDLCFKLTCEDVDIRMYQSLVGDYKIKNKRFLLPGTGDIQNYRVLSIETKKKEKIFAQFEPIPNDKRCFSRIEIFNSDRGRRVYDNSLKNIIKTFTSKEINSDFVPNRGDFSNWQMENLFKLANVVR